MAAEEDAPVGAFPTKGHRKERPGAVVAARVARLHKLPPEPRCIEECDVHVAGVKGSGPKRVQPLASGFFALERMRQATVERKKRTQRAKTRTR